MNQNFASLEPFACKIAFFALTLEKTTNKKKKKATKETKKRVLYVMSKHHEWSHYVVLFTQYFTKKRQMKHINKAEKLYRYLREA